MSDCPVWVLGDVTPEQIEAARASLPKGARLGAISDEGTISYFPARHFPVPPQQIVPRGNWLKWALRR